MDELIQKAIDWADERGILANSTPDKQFLKFMSELGEFCDELAKENYEAAKMELGDVIVTIILYYRLTGRLFDFNQLYNIPNFHFSNIALLVKTVESGADTLISGLLRNLANHVNSNPQECLQIAYDKINKRKTTMVNGVAVKE